MAISFGRKVYCMKTFVKISSFSILLLNGLAVIEVQAADGNPLINTPTSKRSASPGNIAVPSLNHGRLPVVDPVILPPPVISPPPSVSRPISQPQPVQPRVTR